MKKRKQKEKEKFYQDDKKICKKTNRDRFTGLCKEKK